MKNLLKTAVGLALLAMSASSFAQVYAGYPDIPAVGIGSGSVAVDYQEGPGVSPPSNDTTRALGEPNNQSLALGRGGSLILSASPMTLKGDGTDAADFYVYEAAEYESWDTYISEDNVNWTKVASVSSQSNSKGTVRGYDVDVISSTKYFPYVKLVDTSNTAGTTTSGADIDGLLLVSGQFTGGGLIVDTDSRNGSVFNLEKDVNSGAVDVKKINKDGSVEHIPFSTDDSLEPIALSVQGNFDCDDAKDINVLATRKSDGVQLNIIKDQQGNDIATIDNSVTK